MENNPEAAGAAPNAAQTEATTTNVNSTPSDAQTGAPAKTDAPDMHGFTSEQLADMQKFFQANGGYEKVKSKISNPTPAAQPEQPNLNATEALEKEKDALVAPVQPAFSRPQGAITPQEYFAKRYFVDLASEAKYSGISEEISSGKILKEMDALGIPAFNQDGSINEDKVRGYFDLKAQTVPAKQTSTEPQASSAPTVDYIPVEGDITDLNQAYNVIRQDTQFKQMGRAGHPQAAKAEEFIKNSLNKKAE